MYRLGENSGYAALGRDRTSLKAHANIGAKIWAGFCPAGARKGPWQKNKIRSHQATALIAWNVFLSELADPEFFLFSEEITHGRAPGKRAL